MKARIALKRAAEAAATMLGPAWLGERMHRRSVAVLSYHNIVPDGEEPVGDASLHLPVAAFREQLDELAARYPIVGLDVLGRPGRDRAPRVAITFDDAYAGAVLAGIPELVRRGLPATVFVPSDMLDRRTFWWDRLADDAGFVPAERREYALWRLGGSDEAVRDWMRAEGMTERDLPEHAKSATRAELTAAAGTGDIAIGAHGRGHLNFAALNEAALETELVEPASSLSRDFDSYRPWVAYPYGVTSGAVEAAAARHYELGFRIEGGLTRPGESARAPRSLPRINVPAGLSPRGLRLRVSGILS